MPARSRRTLVVVVLVVIVAVAGGAAWYFFLKGDAQPALRITDSANASGKVVDPASLAGTWKVVPGAGTDATTAGYRVKEQFAAGARKVTANGRTRNVTGSLTVAGGKVTAGSFTVDLTTLTSDKAQRDETIKSRGLETNRFPRASFTLTRPITLPTVHDGKVFALQGTGKLTLHGTTKAITVALTAKVSGGSVVVQGDAPIVMADYGIEAPSVGGFVSVADTGSFEFLISLAK